MIDNSSASETVTTNQGRRSFFKGLGQLGVGASFVGLVGGSKMLALNSSAAMDTANQIFQAAVIAEDLATTFYYNALVGPVIMDPTLAGPGGTATNVTAQGNAPNVAYLRAALDQEIQHADLLRAVGNFGSSYTVDPYQTFYFNPTAFSDINTFVATLSALENAFIGAYLNAIREFASLATKVAPGTADGPYGGPYSASQLEYFAEVAASIMGIECEHRVLGPVIINTLQPNNLNFESTDGLTSVYHGSSSAVAALLPFLSMQSGTQGYSLVTARNGAGTVGLASTGTIPAY